MFQDPQHQPYQQPRFIVKVYDAATYQPIQCATFEYQATSNLPGFKRSTVDQSVWYKERTPVSIDLSGYAGKTIIIEFTTADCTLGGHFGYAYELSTPVVMPLYWVHTIVKTANQLHSRHSLVIQNTIGITVIFHNCLVQGKL
ncbi:MAG: hypothetical protein C4308_02180 [Chitinophagaceae bacterium]